MLWIILAVALAALLWYALVGRAWLKKQPWAQKFFAWIEPLELALYKKSETMLIGRLLWVGGLFVTFYDGIAVFVQSLDMTPLTTRVMDFLSIPQDMRGLAVTAAIAAIGRVITWLRPRITKPLELVATSENSMTQAAAIAVAKADVAKDQAVQAVAEAKS